MRSALMVVVLLLAPTLAGCLGGADDERRLAQPTSSPAPVPPRTDSPHAPTTVYNFSDPGYRMTAPWRAGDGWDYDSNQSHYRRVRVIDSRLVAGTTLYYVEEKIGTVGQPAAHTIASWIDGSQWLLLNATDEMGGVDRYQPGLALRFLKNGSFSYNHTRTESSGRVSANESVVIQSRLDADHRTLLFPWGYVEARLVEQTVAVRVGGANRTEAKVSHWVHADFLNDVQYEQPNGELFKLTAAKAGDFRRGKLVT